MSIKKIIIALSSVSIVSCATSSSDSNNPNSDIVAKNESGIVNFKNQSTKNERKITSPISQEEVVKYQEESPISERIHFAFDSDIIPEKSRDELKQIAEFLQEKKKISLIIEGYCDERGTKAYNIALGARRAQSVKNYLVAEGVPAKKLEVVSYGEDKPLAIGVTKEDYAKNRRVEFKIR